MGKTLTRISQLSSDNDSIVCINFYFFHLEVDIPPRRRLWQFRNCSAVRHLATRVERINLQTGHGVEGDRGRNRCEDKLSYKGNSARARPIKRTALVARCHVSSPSLDVSSGIPVYPRQLPKFSITYPGIWNIPRVVLRGTA